MSMRLDDLFDHYDVKEIRRSANAIEGGPGGSAGEEGSAEHELRRIASLMEKHLSPPAPDHPLYEGWDGLLSRSEIDTLRLYAGKYDAKLNITRTKQGWEEEYEKKNRDIIGKYYDEEPPRPENAI